jgi:hypothetical protein
MDPSKTAAGRSLTWASAGCVRFVACLFVALLAACSGGGKSSRGQSSPSSVTQSASASRSTRLLAIGSIDIQRAGRAGVVNAATQRAVLATAQRYVDSAILAPLETGKLGPGYAALFEPGIRPAATGADQGTLTDIVAGKATTMTETSTPVALSALADTSGTLVYAATTFKVTVHATTANGAITINRTVELTLQQDRTSWLVVAYRATVTRTAPTRAPRTTPTTRRSRPRTTSTVRTHRTRRTL